MDIRAFAFVVLSLLVPSAAAQDIPPELLLSRTQNDDFNTDVASSRDLELGDFDGDGDLDVFVVNYQQQDNSLYLNDGSGAFTKVTDGILVNDGGHSRGLAVGDVDGDGDLDIFVVNGGTETNVMYVNQGGDQGGTEGEFERLDTGPLAVDSGVSRDASFADIDGDGDLDLYVPNGGGSVGSPGALNFLYRNDGTGGFTAILQGDAATDLANSKCACFGDVDGDGDMDLFVGNNQGQQNQILLNDGTGLFTEFEHPTLTEDRGETNGCRFEDMNGDGAKDVVLVGSSGLAGFLADANLIYYNLGDGAFSRPTLGTMAMDGGSSWGLAIGDIDGDLDPDILVSNNPAANLAYLNRGRQWQDLGEALGGVSGEPRLGASGNRTANKPVTLSVANANASSQATLVFGFNLLLAPFLGGTLVPTPDIVVPMMSNGNGEVEVTGVVPDGIPAMLDFYFQWWIEDGAAPSGLSATNGLRARTP